ncbi:nucleoside triphosphate pyrophosphohydrolase [Nitrospirillum viridazoti]|uniref:Nucleoside triphosphate pyrophosphohydrolase n=1 Tax=Nitrospirillum viridazoti CBAmc TaxID=1441467 RepID=A0A248JQ38_9PROT|nr:nucleoside triphosphate pyrophosphohydrolase [Nitrospirillum amazonense]ASG20709.1 nucleoside triphosphate pyrophosphohydrolase [Nitrospirillum amazonense CBAmc]TWB37968.1 ATP diphosphatase [Nitrospirillum amazonense]
MTDRPSATAPIDRLLAIMAKLRDPDGGCPWDLEQDFPTIAPHTIEEAYEVADAIEQGDMAALKEELGDLLFQVVFYAQMASERGLWDFNDITTALSEKMVRRHPHVFGEEVGAVADATDQVKNWEAQKAGERAAKAAASGAKASALDGVISGLPALTRAVKLQKRAARVGFDWTQAKEILDKIEEEIGELRAEMEHAVPEKTRMQDELGDLVFALANLARHIDVDPETALRGTNAKFERRFRQIEAWLAEGGRGPGDATLEEMESLWQQAKGLERQSK